MGDFEHENANIKVRELVSTRIGYYFCFVEDVRKMIGKNHEQMISRDVVHSKLEEHILEHVGNLTLGDAADIFIPDYILEAYLGESGNEKRCAFKFYLTWNEEEYIELEYGSCTVL